MADYCFTCGNKGPKEGTCPECGRESGALNLRKMEPRQVLNLAEKVKDIHIPDEYLGLEWSGNVLKKSHPRLANDLYFEHYVNGLQKAHSEISAGLLPSKSSFITAPSTYSKVTFAYSYMQQALNHGFTVAPLLDTMEAKRVLVLAAEKPGYKYLNMIEYDDYITSHVLFLTVTKTHFRYEAYSVIEEMLSRRSRLGLSTFILSRYEHEVLCNWDRTGNFAKLGTARESDNFKKFPAQIVYKEVKV